MSKGQPKPARKPDMVPQTAAWPVRRSEGGATMGTQPATKPPAKATTKSVEKLVTKAPSFRVPSTDPSMNDVCFFNIAERRKLQPRRSVAAAEVVVTNKLEVVSIKQVNIAAEDAFTAAGPSSPASSELTALTSSPASSPPPQEMILVDEKQESTAGTKRKRKEKQKAKRSKREKAQAVEQADREDPAPSRTAAMAEEMMTKVDDAARKYKQVGKGSTKQSKADKEARSTVDKEARRSKRKLERLYEDGLSLQKETKRKKKSRTLLTTPSLAREETSVKKNKVRLTFSEKQQDLTSAVGESPLVPVKEARWKQISLTALESKPASRRKASEVRDEESVPRLRTALATAYDPISTEDLKIRLSETSHLTTGDTVLLGWNLELAAAKSHKSAAVKDDPRPFIRDKAMPPAWASAS